MSTIRRIPPIVTPLIGEEAGEDTRRRVNSIWYRYLQSLAQDIGNPGTGLRFFFQPTPPDDQFPRPGDLWVDSETYIAYTWLNATDEWVELGPSGPQFYQQDDVPSDARVGDLWLDTTSYNLYTAILANNQVTWVEFGPVQL